MHAVAAAVLVVAVAAGSAFAAAGERVIQGDQSAGGIRVGRSTPAQVKQLFGAPTAIRTSAAGQSCVQT